MHSDFKNIEYMYHKPYLCHQAEKVHNIKNMFIPRFHAFSAFDKVPDGFCCHLAWLRCIINRWVQHGLE